MNLKTGETHVDEANVVITARGTLNDISRPKLEGFTDLTIPVMHSAIWDERYVHCNSPDFSVVLQC
jgi:cation diffusion facilitator CzcD-associated flavoprotein CzcO